MIRASNCCTARGGRSGGVVNETKGNILHKAQAHPPTPPSSPLDIHFPVSVAMRRQNRSCQPRPCVIRTYMQALYVVLKMALWAKDEEVCARACVFVCVCVLKRDHSILHGHYGIHYHLNDACVEASICRLTVAWEVSSLCCSCIPSCSLGVCSLAGPHLF